jgi:hypothetical protein
VIEDGRWGVNDVGGDKRFNVQGSRLNVIQADGSDMQDVSDE